MRCWYKNSFAQAFDQMNNVVNGLVSKRLVKVEIWKRHQPHLVSLRLYVQGFLFIYMYDMKAFYFMEKLDEVGINLEFLYSFLSDSRRGV